MSLGSDPSRWLWLARAMGEEMRWKNSEGDGEDEDGALC